MQSYSDAQVLCFDILKLGDLKPEVLAAYCEQTTLIKERHREEEEKR